MKLKEKLAEEYRPDSTCAEELHLGCLTRDAYIAGFEKAREMAADIANEYAYREGTKGPSIEVENSIIKMGEEEVK